MSWFKKNKPAVNSPKVSAKTIIQQMNEPRPLPMGMTEFKDWSDRIISGALVPCDNRDSLVKALAAMLMSLGPTEDHKPDSYFIHALRKAAINEIAHAKFQEVQSNQKLAAAKSIQAVEDAEKLSTLKG